VFQNVSGSAQEYRRLLLVLSGSFAVCTLLALRQYVGPQGLPFDPANPDQNLGGATNVRLGGWYAFRGIFGAHAAMLIPAAVAIAACERDAAIRATAGAFAAVCFCVTLSAGGMLGALAGTLAVAGSLFAARHGLKAVLVLLAMVAVLLVVLPKLPRQNLAHLHRGTALYADNETGARLPTARLRRYQASHSLLAAPLDSQNEASSPKGLLGVGLNRYQKEINAFYRDPYPKPGRRTDDEAAYDMESDEPFTFGFLETATVETGVVGLLALLTLFGTWIAAAQGAFARVALKRGILADIDTRAMLALASLGAGVGALICSVFANPVIRGVGGTFAFFIALAYCAQKWADE
jgi:hypothetical protein